MSKHPREKPGNLQESQRIREKAQASLQTPNGLHTELGNLQESPGISKHPRKRAGNRRESGKASRDIRDHHKNPRRAVNKCSESPGTGKIILEGRRGHTAVVWPLGRGQSILDHLQESPRDVDSILGADNTLSGALNDPMGGKWEADGRQMGGPWAAMGGRGRRCATQHVAN